MDPAQVAEEVSFHPLYIGAAVMTGDLTAMVSNLEKVSIPSTSGRR